MCEVYLFRYITTNLTFEGVTDEQSNNYAHELAKINTLREI